MSSEKTTTPLRVLTQDDGPPSPIKGKRDFNFNEMMDLFLGQGDMSPSSCAQFVAATAKSESQYADEDGNNTRNMSPNRQLLFQRQQAITNNMSKISPTSKKELRLLAAKTYVKQNKYYKTDKTISEPNDPISYKRSLFSANKDDSLPDEGTKPSSLPLPSSPKVD